MAGLGHSVEKVLEPGRTADILGWCASLAIDEAGILGGVIGGGQTGFDHDAVSPVEAKIIGIDEVRDASLDELREAQAADVAGSGQNSVNSVEI